MAISRSILLVTVVWIAVLVAAFLSGLSETEHLTIGELVIEVPTHVTVALSAAFYFFFFLAGFVQRSRQPPFGVMFIVWLLDRVFGDNSTPPYERLLRVDLLFAVGLFVHGIMGIVATYSPTQGSSGSSFSYMCLAGAIGLYSAYLLSRKYPPTLWRIRTEGRTTAFGRKQPLAC